MAEKTKADEKLIQYLTEAYGKEKELETALAAHIEIASRDAYKKRLRAHLKETKSHSKQLERRLKKLGGRGIGDSLAELASRTIATAKGPLHALRGGSAAEKQLKNAKTEYSEEHEEIATYTAIEALAEQVGDSETAKLAKSIRREEERMAAFLEKQIPILTKEVARAEIPAAERRTSSSSRRRRSSRSRPSSTKAGASSRRSSGSKSGSSSRGRSSSSSRRSSGSSSSRRSSGSSSSRRSSGSRGRSTARS